MPLDARYTPWDSVYTFLTPGAATYKMQKSTLQTTLSLGGVVVYLKVYWRRFRDQGFFYMQR